MYKRQDYRSKIIPIEDGMADFNGVKFPIDPMIGVIGTAPDGEDVIDCLLYTSIPIQEIGDNFLVSIPRAVLYLARFRCP